MKAKLPPPAPDREPDPPPEPQPQPTSPALPVSQSTATRRRARRVLGFVVALGVAGVGLWLWLGGSEVAPEPPLPPGITDAEVKQVVEKGRAKVLAERESADAWGNYGLVLLGNLIDREADQCFTRAAALNPNDPRWPYARALIALKRRPEQAEELLRQAITAATASRNAEYRAVASLTLGEALLERREIDAAANVFQKELGTGDIGEARAVLGLALVAVARGEDAEAARQFTRVAKVPHCRKQAAAQLAILARSRGDSEGATRFEREAAELSNDPPWPDPVLDHVLELQVGHRGRGRRIDQLEQAGDIDGAREECRALVEHERSAKNLTRLAVNLARRGRADDARYDESVALLREAVRLDGQDSQAHYTLALVLFTQAERRWGEDPSAAELKSAFREAAAEAKRATELKPDYIEAYLFWGQSLKFLNEPKDAAEPFRKGLGIRADHFMLNLSLGQVLALTGDLAGARTHLELARKLRPTDPRAEQELEKIKGK